MTTPTVHNPTNFEPANYEVLDYLDNKRPEYCGQPIAVWEHEIAEWKADMERVFGPEWIKKIHRCVHCGNGNIRWITAVAHTPTGETVVFGSDCTERLGFANRLAWKLAVLKSKAEAGHARMKIWNARNEFIAANPSLATAIEAIKEPVHAGNTFVKDVLDKLNRYGSLSERQVSAVANSLKRDLERVARKAEEAVEVKGPAPTGRATVEGVILSIKERMTDYGVTYKMLLKVTNNSRVWVTVPSKARVVPGDSIKITATFTVSKDDASFAFGSRPHLVSVTKKEGVAA